MNVEKRKAYMRSYMKEYRHRNPNYIPRTRKKSREYISNLRKMVIEKLGGYFCCKCGCTEERILEINHIKGGGNRERFTQRRKKFYNEILRN